MFGDHGLDLSGIDIDRTRDDYISDTIDDENVPVRTAVGDVPGVEPAVAQNSRSTIRIVPVALHHGGALHLDPTEVSVGNLVVIVVDESEIVEAGWSTGSRRKFLVCRFRADMVPH